MRTKILALSAVVGTLASVSAMAQTNVYSQNAVGYIQVTLYPGYNLITCPLIASPDNTLNTLLNDTNGQYVVGSGRFAVGATVYQYINGVGYVAGDSAKASSTPGGWQFGGTNTILPGQAIWFVNPGTPGTGSNMFATFVGTVPQGSLTNAIYPGYNLVGSQVPFGGDLINNGIGGYSTTANPTNGLSAGPSSGDAIYVYDPTFNGSGQGGYSGGQGGSFSVNRQHVGSWTTPDASTTNVAQGFWYLNNTNFVNNWVETFSVNP